MSDERFILTDEDLRRNRLLPAGGDKHGLDLTSLKTFGIHRSAHPRIETTQQGREQS